MSCHYAAIYPPCPDFPKKNGTWQDHSKKKDEGGRMKEEKRSGPGFQFPPYFVLFVLVPSFPSRA
jgi:hypothetical protein